MSAVPGERGAGPLFDKRHLQQAGSDVDRRTGLRGTMSAVPGERGAGPLFDKRHLQQAGSDCDAVPGEEHDMVRLMDAGWCPDYGVGEVVMVSVDRDASPVQLQDVNGALVPVDTPDAKSSEDCLDDYLLHEDIMQSNNAVCTRTNKAYHCSKCKQSFDMKRCFLKHLQLHFKSKDFECAECGERFYQRHCLELHRVTHLDVRKNKTVSSNKQLLFECKLCRTRFSSICRLKNHIKLLHRHTNATVNSQQKSSSVQTATMQPETAYHICYHCQNTFSDKKSFSMHIKEHSLNFECVACPKSFDSKEELKMHNWTHFSFYSCSTCHSVFKSPRELTRHEPCRTRLVPSAEERLSCDVCSAVFAKQQLLQRHLQRHAKQFRCRHCGAGHHSQSALHAHEQYHGLDWHVYKCSDCPASFRSLAVLRAHQQTHATDASRCSLCKEAFVSEQQRREHKHLFLGNVKCDLCEIQCSGSHGLNMHRRLAHPEARACSLRAPTSSEHVVVCFGGVVE